MPKNWSPSSFGNRLGQMDISQTELPQGLWLAVLCDVTMASALKEMRDTLVGDGDYFLGIP